MYDQSSGLESQKRILSLTEAQQGFSAARELGSTFLALSQKKADKILSDAMEHAQRETERIQAEAYSLGFEKGYREGKKKSDDELALLKEEHCRQMDGYRRLFEDLHNKYKKEKEAALSRLENEIISLVIEAVELVIKEKLDNDPSLVLKAIRQASSLMEGAKKIIIRLSPYEHSLFGREYFVNTLKLSDIQLVEDAGIEQFGFILESESGLIDGQISSQIECISTRLNEKQTGERGESA